MTVYLDYNATCPIKPAVIATLAQAMSVTGNPSSQHKFGRDARRLVELAREKIAGRLNVRPSAVVFCASGTEANNLALRQHPNCLVSGVEHPAILKAAPRARTVGVDRRGLVSVDEVHRLLSSGPGTGILSVQSVNSETGIIQPVADIAAVAKKAGWLVHTDAVQAFGKLAFDFESTGVDLMTVSAHKIGGPQGVAALIVRPGLEVESLIKGGGQERNRRSGTENVAGIAGFGEAAARLDDDLARQPLYRAWRDEFETRIRAASPDAKIWGRDVARVANTCALAMPGMKAATQLMAFDLAGFAVSAGPACSSGKAEPGPALTRMAAYETGDERGDEAGATIRASIGWNSQPDDLDRFARAWIRQAGKAACASSRVRGCEILRV